MGQHSDLQSEMCGIVTHSLNQPVLTVEPRAGYLPGPFSMRRHSKYGLK